MAGADMGTVGGTREHNFAWAAQAMRVPSRARGWPGLGLMLACRWPRRQSACARSVGYAWGSCRCVCRHAAGRPPRRGDGQRASPGWGGRRHLEREAFPTERPPYRPSCHPADRLTAPPPARPLGRLAARQKARLPDGPCARLAVRPPNARPPDRPSARPSNRPPDRPTARPPGNPRDRATASPACNRAASIPTDPPHPPWRTGRTSSSGRRSS